MTLKWPQNGAKSGPKMVQGGAPDTKTKTESLLYHFGSPKTSKMDPKTDPKIIKNRFGDLSFQSKKTWFSRCCFFLFFEAPRRSQTLKIEPKRCNGVQKRGCHFFMKKPFVLQKMSKNDLPWDPQNPPKTQKNWKRSLQKQSWKKHSKQTHKMNLS